MLILGPLLVFAMTRSVFFAEPGDPVVLEGKAVAPDPQQRPRLPGIARAQHGAQESVAARLQDCGGPTGDRLFGARSVISTERLHRRPVGQNRQWWRRQRRELSSGVNRLAVDNSQH